VAEVSEMLANDMKRGCYSGGFSVIASGAGSRLFAVCVYESVVLLAA
jgi:hypothetical protein